MKLTFLGGADEVGASSTLIDIAGKKLLVDVGIRISPKSVRGVSGDQLPDLQLVTEAGGPDFILVTHAHTDHTGALPLVMEQYPDVPVYASEPTIALTKVLQADAQNIMKAKQEEEGELPLFDEISVQRLLDAFQPVQFRQTIRLGDGLQVTYHPSGHIMGAAMLIIESEEGILVMSGDVSMNQQRAVVKAAIPRVKADFLVLESTYGGRLHANRAAEEKRLIETLQRIIERGGKAVIPAFALGRAQEVLQIVHAYRDEIDVPIWVDGMVRAVCRAYNQFQAYLPQNTVRAAKEDDLFFRKNVKAVQNSVQREQIAREQGPAIIVSSSGMLTGGPSAAYVKWLGGDERNGIFLTGYQDEESPGRFIQQMIRDRKEDEPAMIRIDGKPVTLKCELGMYSLSAHADEAELVSFNEGLGAEAVALVHGDEGARHSLASKLRDRGKQVHLPVSGTTLELEFAKRPWGIGVTRGSQAKPLDLMELWESLKDNAGSFYSAKELSQIWWGDANRSDEVFMALSNDGVYFAQSWRRKTDFQVRSPEKVEKSKLQRAIMQAHPDLVGKLVVLRDVNGKVGIGVVKKARIDGFTALPVKVKGRNFPAEALVWVIDAINDLDKTEEKGFMAQLGELMNRAQALRETLLPFERRHVLVVAGEPIHPDELMPKILPEGVTPTLARLAIVLALARDGAMLTAKGLLPREVRITEPMEMNLARQTALTLFPPEARLRKVGMNNERHQMILYFDFPKPAQSRYAEHIEDVAEQTNWEIVVSQDINQQSLGTAIQDLLPAGAKIIKGPSFFLAQGIVQVDIAGLEDASEMAAAYKALTGFDLIVNSQKQAIDTPVFEVETVQVERMEINAAYQLIRERLEPYGLYKTSLKQDQIVLSFISPQVGGRHYDKIDQLAEETGYPMSIHPHPNQNAIMLLAQQKLRQAKVEVKKGPSIFMDRGEVTVTLAEIPEDDDILRAEFEYETGYRLTLNT